MNHTINEECRPMLSDDLEIQANGNEKSKNPIFTLITSTYLLSSLLILMFFVFFLLKVENEIKWSYSLIFIPLYFCLISLTAFFVGLINHPKSNFHGMGRYFFQFTVISDLVLICLALICLNLKIDGIYFQSFSLAFTFAYSAFAISFIFICFLFPGLLDKEVKLYDLAFLIMFYFFALFNSCLLIHLKIDGFGGWMNFKAFIPLYAVLGTHLLLSVKNLFEKDKFINNFKFFIFLLCFCVSLGILIMKMDGIIDKGWAVCCVPLFSMVLLVFMIELHDIFEKYR